jgi:hypothetical protein
METNNMVSADDNEMDVQLVLDDDPVTLAEPVSEPVVDPSDTDWTSYTRKQERREREHHPFMAEFRSAAAVKAAEIEEPDEWVDAQGFSTWDDVPMVSNAPDSAPVPQQSTGEQIVESIQKPLYENPLSRAVVGGFGDAVNGMIDTADEIGQFFSGGESYIPFNLPTVPEGDAVAEAVARDITQFMTGFASAGGMALKGIAKMTAAGAVGDVTFDPTEGNFSTFLRELDGGDNIVTQYLDSKNYSEEDLRGRLANVAEGALIGASIDLIVASLRWAKNNPEVIGEALRDVLNKTTEISTGGVIKEMPLEMQIVAGDKAKTLNPKTVELAEQMRDAGASRDEIWKATGEQFGQPAWFEDGQFMWEIDDSGAKYLTPAEVSEESDRAAKKLSGNKDIIKENVDSLKVQSDVFEKDLKKILTGLRRENKEIKGVLEDYERITRAEDGYSYQNTPLKTVFRHKELEDAYPGVFDYSATYFEPSPYQDYKGVHYPAAKSLELRDDLGEGMTSTGLHEVNHAIQTDQGFPRGNSPETVARSRLDYIDSFLSDNPEHLDKWFDFNRVTNELQAYSELNRILDFMDVKQARSVFNSMQYYKYSHYLQLELGPIPKQGPKRLKWAKDAGQLIAYEEIKDAKQSKWWVFHDEASDVESKLTEYSKDRKGLKNKVRRLQYQRNKLFDETEIIRSFKRERDKLTKGTADNGSMFASTTGEFTPKERYQMYLREDGEAKSRAVQHRMGMSLAERIETPIWKSLDVPESEIFKQYPKDKQ